MSASPKIFGTPRIHFDTIDSTNTVALVAANEGAAEGTLFSAGAQTKGKGRLERQWESTAGLGIYFSLILRPKFHPKDINRIVLESAVAMCEAIESLCGRNAGIKWPNDIYMNRKKVGGILLESGITNHSINHAIVGIGINLLHTNADFPQELRGTATSVMEVSGEKLLSDDLLNEFLLRYEKYYLGEEECGIQMWIDRCVHFGEAVIIRQGDEKQTGIFSSINEDLSFELITSSGENKMIRFGEISLNIEENK